MGNTTSVYQRSVSGATERVTVMAYLGQDQDDADEIRVIHERDGATLEDGIAYHGRDGLRWLADHRSARLAEGYLPIRAE
jgi:hypothetical protein